MEKTDYSSLDFKALEVFKLVYELGSLSAAADKLGQNQSSISYTVDRLRTAFGDPLFVRAGRGVDATARCHEIITGVEDMLDRMADLASLPDFDPARSDLTLAISCNHVERAVLLPPLVQYLQAEAPGIKLQLIQSRVQGHDQLNKGQCDILLSPVQANFENLYRQKVFGDKYVCVVSAGHSMVGQKFTLAKYAKCKHVAVTYEGDWRPLYFDAVEAKGMTLDIALAMPSSGDLLRTIEGTELVLTVPSYLAKCYRGDFEIIPSPFETRIDIYQFWNTRTHHSLAHRWLRGVIADIAKHI
jgi:DNA-binding transcriptional LysR family regulator